MKTLYFWHVCLSLVDALAVTDSKGTLYYLSLGKWNSLVDLVKKDFRVVGEKHRLVPGKEGDCTEAVKEARNSIKQALEHPCDIDSLRLSLKYEYIFGTSSQRRIWDHFVKEIPSGKTSTYSDVARALGRKGSARVIGNACAANRIALFVPCHRVLTSAHTITGYRYGPYVKKALLQQERAQMATELPNP